MRYLAVLLLLAGCAEPRSDIDLIGMKCQHKLTGEEVIVLRPGLFNLIVRTSDMRERKMHDHELEYCL